MMDTILLNVVDRKKDEQLYKSVIILINNIDIITRLREYELPFAKKEGSKSLAGAYEGLLPEELYKRLMQAIEYPINENKRVAILECECGVSGCWPIKVKIIYTDTKVIWTDFEQPYRGMDNTIFWNYSAFGKFEFNKRQYIIEIEKLKK